MLENDITEACESDGTLMLCLLLSNAIECDVEVAVQVTDDTTTGMCHFFDGNNNANLYTYNGASVSTRDKFGMHGS